MILQQGNAFNVNEEDAKGADSGQYITESCVEVGNIKKFLFESTKNGAKFVSIDFETDSGAKANFMRIYYKNNDNSDNFAKKKLDALFCIIDIKNAKYQERIVGGESEFYCPEAEDKRIAFSLQKEEYVKNDGGIGYKMNIMHSFYPDSMKTYSEKLDGKEAKTHLRKYEDKLTKGDTGSGGSNQTSGAPVGGMDDMLPF